MGVLHKLVYILHKLDPHNEMWMERQKSEIQNISDPAYQSKALADVEDAFSRGELDYGRKLFLIKNCIYGVDIQPIAIQISKLRFLISLMVDQNVDFTKPEDNFRIRALPNLETKFVAANTLIGLPEQDMWYSMADFSEVGNLRKKIEKIRGNMFSARSNDEKKRYREEDKKLREQLKEELLRSAASTTVEEAEMIAKWDPYDQNTSSDFFDPEWMFGVKEGFDIVIGNPPYGETIKSNKTYFTNHYNCTEGKYEIFKYFIECGINLLKQNRILSYITPDTWIRLRYFKKLRKYIYDNHTLITISESLYSVFESANVDTNIFFIVKGKKLLEPNVVSQVFNYIGKGYFDINKNYEKRLSKQDPIIEKIEHNTIKLDSITEIWQGLIAYGSKKQEREFTSDYKETEYHRKLLYGSDIGKYFINWSGEWLKYGKWLHRPRPSYIYDRDKILVQRIRNPKLKNRIVATLDTNGYINGTGLSNILLLENVKNIDLLCILGIINSTLINYWFSYYYKDVNVKPEQLRMIPIKIQEATLDNIHKIASNILVSKSYNPNADTSALEAEIDRMVYRLYGLTDDEIKIVEGAV